MARRKVQSPGEILIGFFATANEADARAMLMTASTLVAARFPPPAIQPKKRGATRRPGAVAGAAAAAVPASVQTVVDGQPSAPMTRGPGAGRRRRPDPAAAAAPTNGAAPGPADSPTQAAPPAPVDITLPDQGDPEQEG